MSVRVIRRDGFNEPVTIKAESLPTGVSMTPTVVETDASTAFLRSRPIPTAPAFSDPTWRVSARAVGGLHHELDPGGASGGRITVISNENLHVASKEEQVTIQAGREVAMTLTVVRGAAFQGRVPIEIRNLPTGVRVLDVGLNGVLITESQTERTIRLFAEPWAEPCERACYAVGRVEGAGRSIAVRRFGCACWAAKRT